MSENKLLCTFRWTWNFPKQFLAVAKIWKFGFCLKSKVDRSWWELFRSFPSLEAKHNSSRQRRYWDISLDVYLDIWDISQDIRCLKFISSYVWTFKIYIEINLYIWDTCWDLSRDLRYISRHIYPFAIFIEIYSDIWDISRH